MPAPTATLEASAIEAIPTAIPLTDKPTLTLTSTLTITPTFTSTWTPLPTFSSEDEAYIIFKDLLKGTPDCSFPCWAGIIPGETKWDMAIQLLTPFISFVNSHSDGHLFGGLGEGKCRYEDCEAMGFSYSHKRSLDDWYHVSVFSKDDMVYAINIQGNALPYFRIQDMLRKHGKPSQVYLLVYPYSETAYSPELYLILFYPDKKLVILYYPFKLLVQGGDLSTCFNSSHHISLGLVGIDQGEEWPGIEIANAGYQTTHGFQGIGGFRPIEEVTKMTVDDFYQKGIDENSSLCIVTPEEYWK